MLCYLKHGYFRAAYLCQATIQLGGVDALTLNGTCVSYNIFTNHGYFKRPVYPYQATVELGGFDALILNGIYVSYNHFFANPNI